MKVKFRPMLERDRAFIISAWASSYRDAHSAGIISNANWHRVMRAEAERIVDRSDMQTVVAYDGDDAAQRTKTDLFGFIVGRPDPAYVVYVYVKFDARRASIARWLFEALGVDPQQPFEYGCKTQLVTELREKVPRARWNPVVVRVE